MSPKRDTALAVQLLNDNWVTFLLTYRLTIFEILFELEDLNAFNGIPTYIINGSDTEQDSDKSDAIIYST